MHVKTQEKRILRIIALCIITSVVFAACILFTGCGNDDKADAHRDELYIVAYLDGDGGSITGTKRQYVNYGESTTPVIAVPDFGYSFAGWSDGVKTPERSEKNVDKDITARAVFEKVSFELEYAAGENGSISGDAHQYVKYLEAATAVTAVPNAGFKFTRWSDGVKESTRTDKNVVSDFAVTAEFEILTLKINYIATDGGYIDGDAEQEIEYGQSGGIVAAKAYKNFAFAEWSDGVKTPERQETEIKNDANITALFIRLKAEITYTATGGGHIDGDIEQVLDCGQNSGAVTAIADEGYDFVGWSDGVTEPTREEIDVQTDIAVTAVFKKKVFSVRYRYFRYNPLRGTVEGSMVQTVEYGENSETVVAVPAEGYKFLEWSDGCTDAERTDYNITSDIDVIAYFEFITFTVKYQTNGVWYGSIYYLANAGNIVRYGEQSATVEARPKDGYVFIRWSDGVTDSTRTEYDVKCDMELTAYFGVVATYKVNGNIGGTIKGETYQTTIVGEDFEAVEAIPIDGYAFGGWSDLQVTSLRRDMSAERRIEHIAYFEPIVKTFKYDFGSGGSAYNDSVTLNRNNIQLTGYIIPAKQGYTFAGWYADEEYDLKVINEDGTYMLGYYGFSLETDTLYARWKPIGEQAAFKLLLVFINEVEATLYPAKIGGDGIARNVHHIMTSIDREYCAVARSHVSMYLKDWLTGVTEIDVDAYYTVHAIDEQYFIYVKGVSDNYTLWSSNIPELSTLYRSYNSILSVFGTNDYDGILQNRRVGGSAYTKYGDILLEGFYDVKISSHIFLQNYLEELKAYGEDLKMDGIVTQYFVGYFLHEFIHTCEMVYADNEMLSFHNALIYYAELTHGASSLEPYRQYLRGEFMYDGEQKGIPRKFWTTKAIELLPFSYFEASNFDKEHID